MIFEIVIHLIGGRIGWFDRRHKFFYVRKQGHYVGLHRLLLWWGSAFISFRILIMEQLTNMSIHYKLLSLNPICCWFWPCNLSDCLFRSARRSGDVEPLLCSKTCASSCVANRHLNRTCKLMSGSGSTCKIPSSWCSWNQIGMALRGGNALGNRHTTLQLIVCPYLVNEHSHCIIISLGIESGLSRSRELAY